MASKRQIKFLGEVAQAARRQVRKKPSGRAMPQNLTEEGRRLGLDAMRTASRCRAKRRDGEGCRNPALKGSTRCLKHGGRVEVPAHPHNIRRFLAGDLPLLRDKNEPDAWDRMNLAEQREFIAMLPSHVAEKSRLVREAARVWSKVQQDGYPAWRRLMADLARA